MCRVVDQQEVVAKNQTTITENTFSTLSTTFSVVHHYRKEKMIIL